MINNSIFEYYNEYEYDSLNELFGFFKKVKIKKTAMGKIVIATKKIKGKTELGPAAKNKVLSKIAKTLPHSEEPNVDIIIIKGIPTLITITDIKTGEELTINHNVLSQALNPGQKINRNQSNQRNQQNQQYQSSSTNTQNHLMIDDL